VALAVAAVPASAWAAGPGPGTAAPTATGSAPSTATGQVPGAVNLTRPANATPPPTNSAAARGTGCLIEPDRWADVGSPVIGIVEQVTVDRGDSVRGGQVLVKLRSSVEQAQQTVADTRAQADAEVRAAAVAVDLAQQKHKRAQSLEAKAFISPQALEQSRSELELAQHRLKQAQVQQRIWNEESRLAQAQLGQRTVKSPFDGIVAERFVSAGERVDERPLLRVAVVNPLRVELMVPASQWGRLKTGDTLSVQPELPGAGPASARVAQIDRVLDPASNTFRVRLSLPNPGHQLPAGLRCRVDLDALAAQAPATPPAGLPAATATPATKPPAPARAAEGPSSPRTLAQR